MKKILFILMMLPVFAGAQSVFVLAKDGKTVDLVKYELLRNRIDVSDDIKQADYIIEMVLESKNLGRHKGYFRLLDSKSNKTLYTTKSNTQGAGLYNGYNNSKGIANKIITDKDFDVLLATIPGRKK